MMTRGGSDTDVVDAVEQPASEGSSGRENTAPAHDERPAPAPVAEVAAGRRLLDVRGRLADMTDLGGASRTALFTLFGLNLVDEFDRIAFSTLTPEIRDAFDLTDQQIVAVGSISSMFVLLAAIPVGYLADRHSRLKMAKIAAVTWGVMTLLTGAAWMVPLLFAARFFSGVAKSSNEIVHTGLLVDYYEPRQLPRVFQFHRLANSLSTVVSLLAGAIALAMGWRFTFFLLAVPTFLLLRRLWKLQEPDRGATIHAEAARALSETAQPSYWQATKQLVRIRSMRRMWMGFFVFGIGLLAFAQMLALFFEDVYGFSSLGRGMVSFLFGLGSITGLMFGGQIGTRYTKVDDFTTLMRICGVGFLVFALGILGLGVAPWALLSVAFAPFAAAGLGIVTPIFPSLMVRILPPQIRAQGQSFTSIAIAFGALFAIPIAGIGESGNYRTAFVVLSAMLALAVPILYSSARFIAGDIAAADAALLSSLAAFRDSDERQAATESLTMATEPLVAVLGAPTVEEPQNGTLPASEVAFPIQDYDSLTVAQILPLLPQLYRDELAVIEERERQGKNRRSVISRLELLDQRSAGAPEDMTIDDWLRMPRS